jgi:hypothetical protein
MTTMAIIRVLVCTAAVFSTVVSGCATASPPERATAIIQTEPQLASRPPLQPFTAGEGWVAADDWKVTLMTAEITNEYVAGGMLMYSAQAGERLLVVTLAVNGQLPFSLNELTIIDVDTGGRNIARPTVRVEVTGWMGPPESAPPIAPIQSSPTVSRVSSFYIPASGSDTLVLSDGMVFLATIEAVHSGTLALRFPDRSLTILPLPLRNP